MAITYRTLVTIIAFFMLSGCSLLGANRQVGISRPSGPEVRDVPFEARGGSTSPFKTAADAPVRKRIMVLPFLNHASNRSDEASQVAREVFLKALRRTDEFVVVANSDFPQDVSTFIKNGEYDLEAMAKAANAMGVSSIIEGKILDVRARRVGDEVGIVRQIRARISARVQVRLVNTRNGGVIFNETREAEAEESTTRLAERASSDRNLQDDPILVEAVVLRAFQAALPRIVAAIDRLSWEGRVAMVKGERIYLNAGRISGLQVGDILRVSEEGEDVHDPETGSYIGRVPGRLKGTVEVISYFGRDGAITVVHSGSGFRENDLVELY
ncbi:MAG: CsgG/HfaB family protein [Bdellovibrionales bacterium]|jgi:TolB-like protein|nr:CsgG/HfaB family protein [Bdellovibrionales bacterium]